MSLNDIETKQLTFSTNIISRREEDGSESEHQFTEESRFCVLEYIDAFERVEVDVQRDLRLEFVREQEHGLLFVRRLLTEPEVVKPADHPILQL